MVSFQSFNTDQPQSCCRFTLVVRGATRATLSFASGFGPSLRRQARRPSLITSQPHFVADLKHARSDANVSGEQVPYGSVLACSSIPIYPQKPTSSLIAVSLRSLAVPRALWAPAQAPPLHAPHPALVHVRSVSPVWMAMDLLGPAPLAERAQTPARSQFCQQH